jgi:uncharacterized small protein (DUF1192 family)
MEIDELLRCLQTLLDDDRKRPLEKKVLLAAHNRLALQTDEIERLKQERACLPESLAARLSEMLYACWPDESKNQAPMERLLRDLLQWHEQRTGGGE